MDGEQKAKEYMKRNFGYYRKRTPNNEVMKGMRTVILRNGREGARVARMDRGKRTTE